MNTLQLDQVDAADPRLAHLASNASLVFQPESLINQWHCLKSKLYPPEHDVVRVYCYDGELDDQIRLENTLLQAETSRIIIVAGRRIDGEDTLTEMTAVIERTLKTTVTSEGYVTGWPYLRILSGGPLVAPTLDQVLYSEAVAGNLVSALDGRDFVLHNNTSATFPLTVLLNEELQPHVKAVTFTCGVYTSGNQTLMGFNARWHQPAFLSCIKICTSHGIPFISVHGSLSGYSFTTLPELEGWAEVMLRPLATGKQKILYQKAVGSNRAIVMAVLKPWLEEDGFLHKSSPKLFSKEWLPFMQENLTEDDFCERDLANIPGRFRSIAINLNFPFSNTIGDVSGCAFDMPVVDDALIVLRTSVHEDAGKWTATIGEQQAKPSEHYILAYADQSATLNRAWEAVKTERLADSTVVGYEPVDEDMKRGWHAFAKLACVLLDVIWEKRAEFPEESIVWLEKARENLVNGPWAKYCNAVDK